MMYRNNGKTVVMPSIAQIAQALRERCGLADSLEAACDAFICQRQRLHDELEAAKRERDTALAERDEFRRLLKDLCEKTRAATEARDRYDRLQAEYERLRGAARSGNQNAYADIVTRDRRTLH